MEEVVGSIPTRSTKFSQTLITTRSFAALRISPAGSDARKTAQVRISPGAPYVYSPYDFPFRSSARELSFIRPTNLRFVCARPLAAAACQSAKTPGTNYRKHQRDSGGLQWRCHLR